MNPPHLECFNIYCNAALRLSVPLNSSGLFLSTSWRPNSQTHTKSQRQGRGQNFQTANQAKSNIPLAHFKQAYWEESFHTVLRILNGRYQEQQANKAAIVLSILLDVSRYYTATMPQYA